MRQVMQDACTMDVQAVQSYLCRLTVCNAGHDWCGAWCRLQTAVSGGAHCLAMSAPRPLRMLMSHRETRAAAAAVVWQLPQQMAPHTLTQMLSQTKVRGSMSPDPTFTPTTAV
jgi:hypothetical protein